MHGPAEDDGGAGSPLAGVAASVRLVGADGRGPYAAAAALPATPWQRVTTQVELRRP